MLTLHLFSPTQSGRIVVLGAGGFVGRATIDRLRAAGAGPIPLTRNEVDLLEAGAAAKLASQLTADSTLIFVSARAPVKNTGMLLDNLRMGEAVIEAIKAQPIAHLVYVSSDAVYADMTVPITEASPICPSSLHGLMHFSRETMLKSELPNLAQAIVRPTLIYGPGDPHNGYGPNRFMRAAQQHQDIVLFGQGEERRDHIFIDDVGEIVARCARHRATGSINAVSGVVTSFRSIAESAAAKFEPRVAVVGTPRPGPMPHGGYRAFDPALLQRTFADLRPVTVADGLERMRLHAQSNSAPS